MQSSNSGDEIDEALDSDSSYIRPRASRRSPAWRHREVAGSAVPGRTAWQGKLTRRTSPRDGQARAPPASDPEAGRRPRSFAEQLDAGRLHGEHGAAEHFETPDKITLRDPRRQGVHHLQKTPAVSSTPRPPPRAGGTAAGPRPSRTKHGMTIRARPLDQQEHPPPGNVRTRSLREGDRRVRHAAGNGRRSPKRACRTDQGHHRYYAPAPKRSRHVSPGLKTQSSTTSTAGTRTCGARRSARAAHLAHRNDIRRAAVRRP